MAVAIDDSSASTIAESVSSITFTSHTIAGTDRLLVVCVPWVNFAFSTNVSGVTYGGVAMTAAGAAPSITDGFSVVRSQIWRLINPADGPGSIVVTFSDSSNYGAVGAMSFTGVDQTTPLGTLATATGESTTASVAVAGASGDIVIDAVSAIFDPTLTVGAGQTSFFNIASSGNWRGAGSTEDGDTSVTMSWGLSSTVMWATSGIAVKAAAGGGGGETIRLFFPPQISGMGPGGVVGHNRLN